MDRNEMYEQNWINQNDSKRIYNSISNVIYNSELLPWEEDNLNYWEISRV
jgi:hypothetical protein